MSTSLKRPSDRELEEGKPLFKKTFHELISSRRSENLSENSKLALQDAVFQLIAHHQDVDKLLAEGEMQVGMGQAIAKSDPASAAVRSPFDRKTYVNVGCDKDHGDTASLTVSSLIDMIKDQARLMGMPIEMMAANVCADKLAGMIQGKEGKTANKERCIIHVLLKTVQEFLKLNQFNQSHFARLVCKEETIPLWVVWNLHLSRVLPLDTFILQKLQSEKSQLSFCNQLKACSGKDLDEETVETAKGILSFLIDVGYSNRHATNAVLVKICVAVLNTWMIGILERVTCADSPETNLDLITQLLSNKELDDTTVKRFSTQMISHILSHGTDTKVSQAIENQHLWTYAKSPEQLTNLIKQLFTVFPVSEIGDIVYQFVERRNIKWQNILTMTSTYLLCFQEAAARLKEVLKSLVIKAMEGFDMADIASVFLLARQACSEGPNVFPAYKDWFQITFGDSAKSPANNRKSFVFLMKFLTDIVPHESAVHIKVHILRPPYVPPNCKEVLTEYLSLARTRLSDLKDPIDSGWAGDNTSSDQLKQQKLEEEIEHALSVFESSGKIPSSIIEASIFKKPYYLGWFLPALLKPRPLPDIPDQRMKLIGELKRAEKLPASMYQTYIKACESEKTQLFAGLEIDDDSMEDAIMEPMDQLQYRLNQLLETFSQTKSDRRKSAGNFREIVSHISAKIETVVGCHSKLPEEEVSVFCVHHPGIPRLHVEVVDSILNTVCRMVTTGGAYPKILSDSLMSVTKMLSQHSIIYPAILYRLYKLICEEGPELADHHLSGVTAFLLYIGTTPSLWPPIKIHDRNVSAAEFAEHLTGQLPHHCSQWEMFSLRFCTTYLQYSFCLFPRCGVVPGSDQGAFVPKLLIQKFMYLSCRLSPGLLYSTTEWSGDVADLTVNHGSSTVPVHYAECIFKSTVFNSLRKSAQLTFIDWIQRELETDPGQDFLSEQDRYNYYIETAHYYYIPQSVEEGGCGQSYARACTDVLTCLLNCRAACQAPVNCPHCGNSRDRKISFTPKTQGMVSLLQNFVMYLVNKDCVELWPDHDHSEVSYPWLMNNLNQLMNATSDCDPMKLQFKLHTFFRIATSLSPYLFFTNNISEICENNLQGAAQVISTHLKENFTEGCCLTFHLTAYLIQGMSAVFFAMRSKDEISKFLNSCPLFLSSVLFHWRRLGHLVTLFLSRCGEEVKIRLRNARQWAESFFDGTRVEIDNQTNWINSVSLVAMVTERLSAPPNVLQKLSQLPTKMLASVAECLTHTLTWCYVFSKTGNFGGPSETVLEEWLSHLLIIQPILIADICSDAGSFVRRNLIGSSVDQLKSSTLLKILLKIGQIGLERVFVNKPGHLTDAFLRVHVDTDQLFDSLQPSDGDQRITCPISLKEKGRLRSCLIVFLEKLPSSHLSGLNQAWIEKCDPVIRGIVQRRLSAT